MPENNYGLPKGFTKASKKRRPMMIFRKVRDHLLQQGERAQHAAFGCLYRTPDGRACAVGCLIPEEFNPMQLKGATASLLRTLPQCVAGDLQGAAERWVHAVEPYHELLSALQCLHDFSHPGDWPDRLNLLATRIRQGDFDVQ